MEFMGNSASRLIVHSNGYLSSRGYGGGYVPDASASYDSIDTVRVLEEFLATSRRFLAMDAEQNQD